jgi:IS5 family transposase
MIDNRSATRGLEEAGKQARIGICLATFLWKALLSAHSAVCRFRNELLESDLYGPLFKEINHQLEMK